MRCLFLFVGFNKLSGFGIRYLQFMSEKVRQIVDELNREVSEKYRKDTELFKKLIKAQRDLGLLFGERPTCPFLRPHLMARRRYDRIAHAAETIAEACELLAEAALENDELMDVLDLTEMEKKLVRIDPGYKNLCVSSRLDTFVSGDDFKFLEYNAETPAGVGDQMQLETVLNQILEIREFLQKHPHWRPKPHVKLLQSLFAVYRESGGTKAKPNIAIVDWEGVSTEAEFYILKDYFEENGFRTLIVDPREVDYDGSILRAGTFEVDIIYKRVLTHELLERCEEDHPIIQAYTDGNICMANSFRVKLAHKKASFAILSDEKYTDIFTDQQLEIIRQHIPWTRRVMEGKTTYENREVELLEFLRKNRERFLLKPNDDYGGKGITLGWEVSDADWDNALKEALDDSFIAQERADIEKKMFPVFDKEVTLEELLVDFDPFLFISQAEGGLVRLSSSSLVNVTQGGGQTALIVLENY